MTDNLIDKVNHIADLAKQRDRYSAALDDLSHYTIFDIISVHGGTSLPQVDLGSSEDGIYTILLGLKIYYTSKLDIYTALVDKAIAELQNERI